MLLDSDFTFDNTDTQLTDVSSNEIASGNGYTTGGLTLTSVTWTRSGAKTVFNADNAEWEATGGPLATASYAVVYDDTHADDLLIGYIDLGGDLTTLENGKLVINFNDSDGIFYLNRAA
jgi:hypothetical protein